MPTVDRRTFLLIGSMALPMLRLPSAAAPPGPIDLIPLVSVPSGALARCSFCNRARTATAFMVAAAGVQICSECIALCAELIGEEDRREAAEGGGRAAGALADSDPPLPDWYREKRAPSREEVIAYLRASGTEVVEGNPEWEDQIARLVRLLDPTDLAHRTEPSPREDYIPADRPRPRTDQHQLSCSFCRRAQSEVRKLIAGPNSYVCNDCVAAAGALVRNERK